MKRHILLFGLLLFLPSCNETFEILNAINAGPGGIPLDSDKIAPRFQGTWVLEKPWRKIPTPQQIVITDDSITKGGQTETVKKVTFDTYHLAKITTTTPANQKITSGYQLINLDYTQLKLHDTLAIYSKQ